MAHNDNTAVWWQLRKIWEGDVLVHDFIPCLDAEGVPCPYDAVNQVTYYNDGTGDFEYGEMEGA